MSFTDRVNTGKQLFGLVRDVCITLLAVLFILSPKFRAFVMPPNGQVNVALPGFSATYTATAAANVADSNTVAGSLCRSPDGQDTDNAATDWTFCTTLTIGTANL